MVGWISPEHRLPHWQVAVTSAVEGNLSFRYDDPGIVIARRRALGTALQIDPTRVMPLSLDISYGVQWLDQIPWDQNLLQSQGFSAEGVWLPTTANILFILIADCYPLAFFDHHTQRIGIFHAGQAELANGLLNAFLQLGKAHGVSLSTTHCFIGPGICPEHYWFENLPSHLPQKFSRYIHHRNNKHVIDLKTNILDTLQEFGFQADTIHDDGRCTYESPELFSHRRSQGHEEQRLALLTRVKT